MSKELKPQIRFKGFEDDWKITPISKSFNLISFKPYIAAAKDKGKNPVIQQGINSVAGFSDKSPCEDFEDTVVLGDHTLSLFHPTTPFLVASDGIKILKSNFSDGKFFYYFLDKYKPETEGYKRHFTILIEKTGYSPDKIEQKEISKYLDLIDNLISETEREIGRLEKMKQASLQKMFPRPGSTTPEIRFAGFTEPWEEISLDNISEIFGRIGFRGYTIADIVPKGQGAISLSPTNLVGTNSVQYDTQTTYISNKKYLESPEIMVFPGDVVFVKTASVGRVAYIDHIICDTTLNPQLVVLKKLKCDGRFLSLALATEEFQNKVIAISGGGVLKTMSQVKLGEQTIKRPSLEEQKAIGEYFRNLDSVISAKRRKLEKLRQIKQACLDKMFVNATES